MTNEDIIRMAQKANLCDAEGYSHSGNMPDIERFAALIAAAEREACAVIANEYHGIVADTIYDRITARGQS